MGQPRQSWLFIKGVLSEALQNVIDVLYRAIVPKKKHDESV